MWELLHGCKMLITWSIIIVIHSFHFRVITFWEKNLRDPRWAEPCLRCLQSLEMFIHFLVGLTEILQKILFPLTCECSTVGFYAPRAGQDPWEVLWKTLWKTHESWPQSSVRFASKGRDSISEASREKAEVGWGWGVTVRDWGPEEVDAGWISWREPDRALVQIRRCAIEKDQ